MSNHNIQHPHRKSIRLKEYDYSQEGTYFITICTYNRKCTLGNVNNGKMRLNKYGEIIKTEWLRSSEIREEIQLDEQQIMPNHFHAIVFIVDSHTSVVANGRSLLQMKPKSLSSLIAGFKSSVTSKINKMRNTPGAPVWQRNYYEHIIGYEEELNKVREYIINNPLKWELDIENPDRKKDYKDFTDYLKKQLR